jgi:predicted dehydrogenase
MDLGRAQRLGRRFGIERCTDDYHAWLADVDGVIVAVPNHLHAPVARELLEHRVAVLVEKPLASTLAEGQALAALSRTSGVPVQVGHMYRFSKTTRLVKRAVDEGWLGPLRGFSVRYGVVSSWPATSGFYWRKEQAGGGVLMDMGPHVLDLLRWWLGEVSEVEYYDDVAGGVEADCRLSLTVRTSSGDIRGDVALSRLRWLGGTATIVGERFTIECDIRTLAARIRPAGWGVDDPSFAADFAPAGDSFRGMFVEQLRAFAAAIRDGTVPLVPADAVLPAMAVIERCYRERRPLEHTWQVYPAVLATP